ncbi:putative apoptosis-inducing factor 1, mitochondrial [Apostichopus japonicus]|uniref:Putative apoptosis-inducing factor 1, mitochondrial n=1 Tax=Stichopus japonicus TaxID=307972 RepID=A0A2G8LM04_STIJA|nr:putative apoptosis-inducing factor 1, mitochondrial [Apostichopus japonicus]
MNYFNTGSILIGQTVRQMAVESSEGIGSKGTLWLVGGAAAFVGLGTFVYSNGYIVFNNTPDKSVLSKSVVADAEKDVPLASTEGNPPAKEDEATSSSASEPAELPAIPGHAPYLLIGAGTASFAAFRAIRANDSTAKILVIGEEDFLPYMRPPLSKELWFSDDKEKVNDLKFQQWNGKREDSFYCKPSELPIKEKGGVAVLSGHQVVRLDVHKKTVTLDDGTKITYDKCLIATGGNPRNLPEIEKAGSDVMERVTLFRNIKDFKRLDEATQTAKSVAIIGGGFLGSELACALGKRGKEIGAKVTQFFPEAGNMGRVLPEYLSKWTTNKVESEGVDVITGVVLKSASLNTDTNQVALTLSNGAEVLADHVVVAVGLEPNTALSITSGLEVDDRLGGYRVNAELEARRDVWVAGDASCFYDMKLGRRRVEHHDHAVVSGRLAGENMTGAAKPYWHQSMFWSDLGPNVGYEAIGIVDSSLETVGVFAKATEKDTPKAVVEATGESIRSTTEEAGARKGEVRDINFKGFFTNRAITSVTFNMSYSLILILLLIGCPSQAPTTSTAEPPVQSSTEDYGKGVVFYMKDETVVGIVLWNVFNRMPIARRVIKEGKQYSDLSELAKLFSLYDKED